jgi:hypothetical protein
VGPPVDCDDTDAAIHPGQIEYLGNGVDDDCNDGSPDAPPGGVTGKLYGWGNGNYGALGTGACDDAYTTPKPVALGDDVVHVNAMLGNGYAVLADGTARAWGVGSFIGDGQNVHRYSPVQPVGPGGTGKQAHAAIPGGSRMGVNTPRENRR